MFKKLYFYLIFLILNISVMALDAPRGLVPDGLSPGDTFYIVFAGSNTVDGAQSAATYVNYAASVKTNGIFTNEIPGWTTLYGHDDSSLITTSAFTATNRPIYNTNGDKVADNRAEFFSNSQDNAIGYDESGNVNANNIWTGFNFTGSNTGIGDDSLGGNDSLTDGCLAGNAAESDNKWAASILAGGNGCTGVNLGLYVLSPLLTVPTTAVSVNAPPAITPAGLIEDELFYIIFVTSATTLGNLTPAEFNSFVNSAADLSSIKGTSDPTITWKAWLGHDDGTLQTQSLFTAENSKPIYNLNGDKVGDNYADIVDGSLDNSISYDETGTDLGSVKVHTGTLAVGGGLIAQGDNTLGGADSSNDGCALGDSDSPTGQAWASNASGDQGCDDDDYSMYAVSPLLKVNRFNPPVITNLKIKISGEIDSDIKNIKVSGQSFEVVNGAYDIEVNVPDSLQDIELTFVKDNGLAVSRTIQLGRQ